MKNQKYVVTSNNKELMAFLKKDGMLNRIRKSGIPGLYSRDLSFIRDRFELSDGEVRIKLWLNSQLQIREVKRERKSLSFGDLLERRINKHNSIGR